MVNDFSHLNAQGDPTMVDVSGKEVTERIAHAQSIIELDPEIISRFKNDEIHTKKGPVFQTAIIAGVMAAKKTSELIPLCHPIGLDKCTIEIALNKENMVDIKTTSGRFFRVYLIC